MSQVEQNIVYFKQVLGFEYYSNSAAKYNDALGCFKTLNNMEIVIVEASSGKLQENTVHTIEDCLKLLECGISSLMKEAILNKNASIATFRRLEVLACKLLKIK